MCQMSDCALVGGLCRLWMECGCRSDSKHGMYRMCIQAGKRAGKKRVGRSTRNRVGSEHASSRHKMRCPVLGSITFPHTHLAGPRSHTFSSHIISLINILNNNSGTSSLPQISVITATLLAAHNSQLSHSFLDFQTPASQMTHTCTHRSLTLLTQPQLDGVRALIAKSWL